MSQAILLIQLSTFFILAYEPGTFTWSYCLCFVFIYIYSHLIILNVGENVGSFKRMNSVTVRLSYDRLPHGLVSVKIRVTSARVQKRFALQGIPPVILSPAVYNKLVAYANTGNNRVSEEVRLIYQKIEPQLKRAKEIVAAMKTFSWQEFKEVYTPKKKEKVTTVEIVRPPDMMSMLKSLFEEYELSGQPGTADLFSGAASSLKWFLSQPKYLAAFDIIEPNYLPFEKITVEFLTTYEAFMLQSGKQPKKQGRPGTPASVNTIGMYLRQVRIAYRRAMSKKLKYVDSDLYPFAEGGYTIPTATKAKQAVPLPELKMIADYQPETGSIQQRSLDLWMFSYMGNGMNMFDLCKLRWEDNINLRSGSIRFFRKKTVNTSRAKLREVEAFLSPEMRSTLKKWGTPFKRGAYVFPFLQEGMTARKQRNAVDLVISQINKDMKKVVSELDLSEDIKTKFARHSFSMVMAEEAGAPILVISKLLGHASVQTTEHYLGQFSTQKVKQMLSTTRSVYEKDPE